MYYHEDSIGNVRLLTNGAGTVTFGTDYLPFGKPFGSSGTEDYKFLDSRTTKSSGMVHFGARYYEPDTGRFITPDSVLGSLSTPASTNRWAYCMNDPINRADKDGTFSMRFISNAIGSVGNGISNLAGDALEIATDATALAFNAAADLAGALYDAGSKFFDDVMDAYARVAEAVWAGVVSVKDAWDNLDSGLKQWIVMGVSMAVSFIPLVGPLISCIIDGTFVDMINALRTGDWAMLGMCCLNFVPGGGGAFKGLGKLLGGVVGGGVLGIAATKLAKGGFSHAAKVKALEGMALKEGGKSLKCTKESAEYIASKHFDDIAGRSGATTTEGLVKYMEKGWETRSPMPGGISGQKFWSSSHDLYYIVDTEKGSIVNIFPPW